MAKDNSQNDLSAESRFDREKEEEQRKNKSYLNLGESKNSRFRPLEGAEESKEITDEQKEEEIQGTTVKTSFVSRIGKGAKNLVSKGVSSLFASGKKKKEGNIKGNKAFEKATREDLINKKRAAGLLTVVKGVGRMAADAEEQLNLKEQLREVQEAQENAGVQETGREALGWFDNTMKFISESDAQEREMAQKAQMERRKKAAEMARLKSEKSEKTGSGIVKNVLKKEANPFNIFNPVPGLKYVPTAISWLLGGGRKKNKIV